MNKIVILDGYTINPSREELELFCGLGEVTIYDRTPPHLTAARIADAQYIYTDNTYISDETMERCPNLKWIGLLATGINSVDTASAKERGITVCNVPSYGANTVAQHTWALMLYVCNQLFYHSRYVKSGLWAPGNRVPYWEYPALELWGKTLGIFGYGPIGQAVAQIGAAFGMRVLVSTAHGDPSHESSLLSFVDEETLLCEADIITLHCALTEEREGFINEETISKMKAGVILINTARGKLINEKALLHALNSKKVGFAALDVMAEEPPARQNPLLHMEHCFVTPHCAWSSRNARIRLCQMAYENLKAYQEGNPINLIV